MQNEAFKRFDPPALYVALERERLARGLSWRELEQQVGVAASTMKRMARGGRYEVDGVMFVLQWLGRSAEDFLR
jgi:hypothetical protein